MTRTAFFLMPFALVGFASISLLPFGADTHASDGTCGYPIEMPAEHENLRAFFGETICINGERLVCLSDGSFSPLASDSQTLGCLPGETLTLQDVLMEFGIEPQSSNVLVDDESQILEAGSQPTEIVGGPSSDSENASDPDTLPNRLSRIEQDYSEIGGGSPPTSTESETSFSVPAEALSALSNAKSAYEQDYASTTGAGTGSGAAFGEVLQGLSTTLPGLVNSNSTGGTTGNASSSSSNQCADINRQLDQQWKQNECHINSSNIGCGDIIRYRAGLGC